MGTLPDRRAAVAAWRALPAATRAGVLRLSRSGQPHPLPDVARVAFDWARRTRGWPQFRPSLLALVLLLVPAATAVLSNIWGKTTGLLVIAPALLLTIPLVFWTWRGTVDKALVEVSNLEPLLRYELLSAPDPVPDPLVLDAASAFRGVGWPAVWAFASVTSWYLALGDGWSAPVIGLFITGVVTGFSAVGARIGMPRGRRALVLDSDALVLPHLKMAVPWRDIALVDAGPAKVDGRTVASVRWLLRDGASIVLPVARIRADPETLILVSRHHLTTPIMIT